MTFDFVSISKRPSRFCRATAKASAQCAGEPKSVARGFLNADLISKAIWGINIALYAARIPRSNGVAACLKHLNPVSNDSQIIDRFLLHAAFGVRVARNAQHFRFFSQLQLVERSK
jgi:hypothetical protein